MTSSLFDFQCVRYVERINKIQCAQRYFFQPIDSARSRKDWRSIIMPYLRMSPFWFPVTRQRRLPGPYFLGCVFVRLVMAVSYLSIVLKANGGATWIDQQTLSQAS